MLRKLVVFALVLGLASISYAGPDPISNWETTASPDGWHVCGWGTQGDTLLQFGETVGVTRGVGSLGTYKTLNQLDGGKTWGWNINWDPWTTGHNLSNSQFWTALHTAGMRLQFDITYDPLDMTDNGGDKFFDSQIIIQCQPTSGSQINMQVEHLAAWDGLSKKTIHVSIDTSPERDALDAVMSSSSGINWIQFIIGWEAGPGWSGQGNVYYDDFKLKVIPEPATMALLGLGALALIRRKR
jgi:hypothetical protein